MLKLTTREKSSLIFEGIITVILLLLINIALIGLIQDVIQNNAGVGLSLVS